MVHRHCHASHWAFCRGGSAGRPGSPPRHGSLVGDGDSSGDEGYPFVWAPTRSAGWLKDDWLTAPRLPPMSEEGGEEEDVGGRPYAEYIEEAEMGGLPVELLVLLPRKLRGAAENEDGS